MQSILADTQFLAANSIMDYSLLTALDEEKGELVVGIIGKELTLTINDLYFSPVFRFCSSFYFG